jgi:hypothetical protein
MESTPDMTAHACEVNQRRRAAEESRDLDLARWRQELSGAVEGIRRHLRTQDEGAARIERRLADLSHLVTGNGTPERGIIVRLDRVENVVWELRNTLCTTVSWFLRPAAGTVGLAAVAAIAIWIARFGLTR